MIPAHQLPTEVQEEMASYLGSRGRAIAMAFRRGDIAVVVPYLEERRGWHEFFANDDFVGSPHDQALEKVEHWLGLLRSQTSH